MQQAVLSGPRTFRLDAAATPSPGPGEVLVKVRMSGVCSSELGAWRDGEGAPRLLGHEVAGTVAAVGAGVAGLVPGDPVTGLFHKGFADYAVAPQDRVAAIPPGIAIEHAFGEPIACAMSGARRTPVDLGDRVAVVGLGFMGLLMLQLLRLKGPAHILGIDMRDDALAAGRGLGADATARPGDLAADLKAVFPFAADDPRGFDMVVEATGTQAGLTLAVELVRFHGVLSILGYHQGGPRQVDMQLMNFKACDVVNAHERRAGYRMDCMRRGLALAAAGRLQLAPLATHGFPLDRLGDAFAVLQDKPAGFIKSAVLLPG
ncbi:MAG: alcohol dehydrogenase catalytic domain-containing protein [Alphaproteobacteria bacterium]